MRKTIVLSFSFSWLLMILIFSWALLSPEAMTALPCSVEAFH